MKRVALVCPGRGTYTRSELGIFSSSGLVGGAPAAPDYIQRADRWRASIGRTPVSELDSKERFSSVHLKGENAAALIFTAGAVDARSVSEDLEVVCVCGNSMGWYTALHVAGVLGFDDGLRLADTMGGLQAEEGVVGGQVIVPVVDSRWRRDPALVSAVDDALAEVSARGHRAFPSIELGGYRVLAGDDEAVRLLLELLPSQRVGEREYPFQLLGHSAFHTPLMERTSQKGQGALADLPWRAPKVSLVDGRGHVFRPLTASPRELFAYTLGHQVTATYDFSVSVRVALREFAPDALVLLGPGDTLGGAIGMTLVEEGWSGIRSKEEFAERQSSDAPVLYAMGRAEQRQVVVAGGADL